MSLSKNTIIFTSLVILVFVLGAFLRMGYLTKIPVSLGMDELSIAYNSYSILKTGQDEFGTPVPLAFRSVGDYKPALLIYSMVPAMAVFGLTEFGARITVAFIATLTVLAVFWVTHLLTKNKWISLLTALSLAISPWHIKFSRATFEASLGLFLIILGVGFFLKSLEKKGAYFWLSAISFALALYAYHAERVFVPLFVLGLGIIYKKEILKYKTKAIISLVVGLIVFLPFLTIAFTPQIMARADMTFLSKDIEISRFLHKPGETLSLGQNIFDNNGVMLFNFWAKRYLDYFDPGYIFIRGMGFSIPGYPDIGILYVFELPFVLIGGYLIFFKDYFKNAKIKKVILLWLLLGPLAASLANNAQHPLRELTAIPVFQLFSGTGIYYVLTHFKPLSTRLLFSTSMSGVALVSLGYFVVIYFVCYQYFMSEYLMDGWKKAALFAWDHQHEYARVNLDPRFGTQRPDTVGIPYVYLLFYGQVDPVEFHKDPRRLKDGYYGVTFRNFTYSETNWAGDNSDKNQKNGLFIASPWIIPAQDNEILAKFYLYNGKEILRAVNPK